MFFICLWFFLTKVDTLYFQTKSTSLVTNTSVSPCGRKISKSACSNVFRNMTNLVFFFYLYIFLIEHNCDFYYVNKLQQHDSVQQYSAQRNFTKN